MKILMVIRSMERGGAEHVMATLGNAFAARGNHVVLAVLYPTGSTYPLDAEVRYINLCEKINNTFCEKVMALRKQIKRMAPDVIISFISDVNIVSCIANICLRGKLIVSERSDPSRIPKGIILRSLRRICYPMADGLVFQTKNAQMYFNKRIQKRSLVIMNPVVFEPLHVKAIDRKKKISVVSRLQKEKNVDMSIRAFKFVENAGYELHIYGDGPCRKNLEQLAGDLCNRVIFFHGFVDNVMQELADTSIFLLTSSYEGMPNVLIEAMISGCACISTRCPIGGPEELIENNSNGLLVQVGDQAALNQALRDLILHDDKRRALGEQARRIIDITGVDSVMYMWEQMIEGVMKNARFFGY